MPNFKFFFLQTVTHGQQATFACAVRGSPMPSVSWFLNGQQLEAHAPGVVALSADGAEHKIVLDSTQWAGTVLCRQFLGKLLNFFNLKIQKIDELISLNEFFKK